MSITFRCPHCQGQFKNVKDELAGKRTKCPGCQKVIQIPAPTAAAASAEDVAAEVLSDPPPASAPAAPSAPIVFNCFFCDEQVTVAAELAGKQAPCPHCRRIVKVPLPVKEEPKDWRHADRQGPSAAKPKEEVAPVGAWGSTTSRTTVSEDALLEAEAIPEERIPLTKREKFNRYALIAVGSAVIAGGFFGISHFVSSNRQEKALREALGTLDKDSKVKLRPEVAAEVHRGAGEYYLQANNLDDAVKHFRNARGLLGQGGSPAHEALLLHLALSQVDLGGSREQEIDRTRMKWNDAQKEIQQTLQRIQSPETRHEAVRAIGRKLIAKGHGIADEKAQMPLRALAIARTLSPTPDDAPEMIALVGLEMLDDRKQAEEMARDALKPYEERAALMAKEAVLKDKEKKAEPLPIAPALIALLVALEQGDKADKFVTAVPKPAQGPVLWEARVGYAEGLAYLGKWKEAKTLAAASGDATQRVQALLAVADVAADKSPGEVKEIVSAVVDILEKDRPLISPWQWWHLARAASQAELTDRVQPLVDKLPGGGLKQEIQAELLRGRLAKGSQADLEGMKADAAKGKGPRALELLARHAAQQGASSAAMQEIGGWDEALRSVGYIGVALGMQDAERGAKQQIARK